MSSILDQLKPVINNTGQVMVQDVPDLVLCKPRLIPLKSFTLERLEKMQKEAQDLKKQTFQENKPE
ncbi:BBSome interacting protein 1 [Rhynchophorus ferrugineus]|uniref:BBSome interacting protein 1 n=1 Tax=Rhynchophorus ferrugineus TaxID=354439 RepID=UPI003FCC4CE3